MYFYTKFVFLRFFFNQMMKIRVKFNPNAKLSYTLGDYINYCKTNSQWDSQPIKEYYFGQFPRFTNLLTNMNRESSIMERWSLKVISSIKSFKFNTYLKICNSLVCSFHPMEQAAIQIKFPPTSPTKIKFGKEEVMLEGKKTTVYSTTIEPEVTNYHD